MLETPRTDQALSAPALQTPPSATTHPSVVESIASDTSAGDHAALHTPQRSRSRFRNLNLRPQRPRGGLWSNTSFMRLWIGESISAVGSQITSVALPLLAALTLDASPGQMGLLSALESLPVLIFGLLAGA